MTRAARPAFLLRLPRPDEQTTAGGTYTIRRAIAQTESAGTLTAMTWAWVTFRVPGEKKP